MIFMNREINLLVWNSKYGRNSSSFSDVYSVSCLVVIVIKHKVSSYCALRAPLIPRGVSAAHMLMVLGGAACKLTAEFPEHHPGWVVMGEAAPWQPSRVCGQRLFTAGARKHLESPAPREGSHRCAFLSGGPWPTEEQELGCY